MKPETFLGAIYPFILLEQFQPAGRLNVRLSGTFRVEFVVKKVPMHHVFSECLYLHLSVSFQHASYSLIYHQRYTAPDSVFK